jgi:L-threonylcarbamoyladenylate synthase
LTLVLPKQAQVPELVTAGLTTVGVRCPRHQLARELISAVGFPLAAPSANRFGRISPTTAEHVRESFAADSPLVLDGGPCQVGLESTIVGWRGEQAVLLRPGGVPREEIERLVGPLTQPPAHSAAVHAPGMLPSHYAPRTPLEIIGPTTQLAAGQRLGLLSFQEPMDKHELFTAIEVLSATGDLREAAANFFAALRRLDALQLDRILATPVPAYGVGLAMTDRLTRAAAAFRH